MSTAGDTLRGPPQPLPQGCQRPDPGPHRPHRHLLQRHEVCALPDPLEDLGQMGVDEGVVWKAAEHSERGRLTPRKEGAQATSSSPAQRGLPGGRPRCRSALHTLNPRFREDEARAQCHTAGPASGSPCSRGAFPHWHTDPRHCGPRLQRGRRDADPCTLLAHLSQQPNPRPPQPGPRHPSPARHWVRLCSWGPADGVRGSVCRGLGTHPHPGT